LIAAARNEHEACVRVLIAANADVAYADGNGTTALHDSAAKGRASICRVLIDEGASLTAVNRYGKTPLQLAKEGSHAACVAILEAATTAAVAAAMGGAV